MPGLNERGLARGPHLGGNLHNRVPILVLWPGSPAVIAAPKTFTTPASFLPQKCASRVVWRAGSCKA